MWLHMTGAVVPLAKPHNLPRSNKIGQTKEEILTLVDRVCPKCSFDQPRRMPRESWMARRIMPYFGCYPWECPLCRVHFYRKNRVEREQNSAVPSRFGSQEMSR
jgi:rubredoxin